MVDTKSLLMGAVPGAALAVLLVFAIPGSALVGSNVMTDSVGPHGYVTVSVVRDGQEIYHNEQHNLITTAGFDFISAQVGGAGGTATAQYIALTNTAITPAVGDTTLSGEITSNGLARAQGTYAHSAGASTFTISKTFTATGAQSAQAAGLFDASSGGTMVAENTFTAVTLASGDQLTITWTITLS